MSDEIWVIRQQDIGLGASCPMRVVRSRAEGDYRVRMHTHDFYELVLCAEGEYRETTKAGARTMKSGHALVLLPGEAHAPELAEGTVTYMVNFVMDLFGDDLTDFLKTPGMMELFFYHFLVKETDGIPLFALSDWAFRECLSFLDKLLSPPPLADERSQRLYRKSCFTGVMLVLASDYAARHATYADRTSNGRLVTALIAVESLLQHDNQAIAQAVHERLDISRAYLSAYFKEHMGRSLNDYINHRKVVRSCGLLFTDQSVTEIALAYGFYDTAHYSRLFKRYIGMTPTEYRKRMAPSGVLGMYEVDRT